MLCLEPLIFFYPPHLGQPQKYLQVLASPKIGRPIKTMTSSKVGQNSPQATVKVWVSTLHRETKNGISLWHILMAIHFDRFRAFFIPFLVSWRSQDLLTIWISNPENRIVLRFGLRWQFSQCNFYSLYPHPQYRTRVNENTLTFFMVPWRSLMLWSSALMWRTGRLFGRDFASVWLPLVSF